MKKNEKKQKTGELKPIITPSYSVAQTDIASAQSFPKNNLDVVTKIGASESLAASSKEALPKNKSSDQSTDSIPSSSPSSSSLPQSKPLWQQKIISFFKDKWNISFLVILFLGLLIRLKYIWQESIWNDSAVHVWFSVKVTQDPLFFFSQQYLGGDYAVPQTIAALIYLFVKNSSFAWSIVTLFYGLLGIIFIFLLGKELRNSFTGVMAAAILAFNHIFWFYSVRPLADSPLLVTTIILLYCMLKLEREKKMMWGVFSGILFLIAMFTKVQSALFVFALLLYYIIFKRKKMFSDRPILTSWLIPVGFILVAHVLARVLFNAHILDRIFTLFLTQRGMPYGFEAAGMLHWIFGLYLFLFAIIGAILIFIYKQRDYYFGIILFLFYWIFFEINVDNTQDRYMLPLLSVAIILALFAIEEIGSFISLFTHKQTKTIFVLIVVALLCWNYYPLGDKLIYSKSLTYTGYQEAGQWIKDNIPPGTPLFAGEPRSIRAFVERDFAGPDEWSDGGSIWYLRAERYLENKSAFEQDLARLNKESDVYVVIDIWEYTQPKWYYPIRKESIDYFQKLGFTLVNVIQRDLPSKEGLQKNPVIFILKKDKEV